MLTAILKRSVVGLAVLASLLVLALVPAAGHAEGTALIAQSYQTSETNVTGGALMSLQEDSVNTVELSDTGNSKRLIGVVGDDAFLELSSESAGVQVVTSGAATALVSDINGSVKVGDRVTASPIKGIGMKATSSSVIVGVVQGNPDSANATERTLTDQNGKSRTVTIAAVPIQVNVSAYIIDDGSAVPQFLQGLADSVAGKEVSPVRVLLASLLLLLLFASVVTLLYASVNSSMISIGRNPLSENALRKNAWRVALIVIGVIVVGLAAVYAILKI